MTAPGRGERRDAGSEPASVQFSEAEKLMAQWEARHDIAAAGRRPTAVSVAQYLAHNRCMDACSAPEHRHTPPRPPRPVTPPDPKPHFSDLLAWVVPPASKRDERAG